MFLGIIKTMYKRILPLGEYLRDQSLFLFGPRQTGKTTLLRTELPGARYLNLLEADTFRELSARPETIRRSLTASDSVIVIDEIQRLPGLLNEVQAIMDARPDIRFVLTGSSARSLRRGGVNLLGGRAAVQYLFPLISTELEAPRIEDRLTRGSLPAIIDSAAFAERLSAYVGVYLQEEIRAEGLVRNIETFSRFLEVAALCNGEQVNFSSVANDAGVPPRTVREHFQILQDTLLGTVLPAYQGTQKRKPVSTAKFYLFDLGVANFLMKRHSIQRGSREYGQALEQLVLLELQSYLSYRRIKKPLTYWRSKSQIEVDFVIGDEIAIEVKSSSRISSREMKPLHALADEVPLRSKIIVCEESQPWSENGVEVLPVEVFLQRLWAGEIVA